MLTVGGSRLAGGFGGCFRKKLAESWFIAFGVGVIGEGLGGFNQGEVMFKYIYIRFVEYS